MGNELCKSDSKSGNLDTKKVTIIKKKSANDVSDQYEKMLEDANDR